MATPCGTSLKLIPLNFKAGNPLWKKPHQLLSQVTPPLSVTSFQNDMIHEHWQLAFTCPRFASAS